MRQFGWLPYLSIGILTLTFAACDPSILLPKQTQPPPPPSGQTSTPMTTAPNTAANQQIRALEERVRELEHRLAAVEQRQGVASPGSPKPAEKAQPTLTISKAPTPPPTTSPSHSATPSSPDTEKIYSEGLRLYQAKQYQAARNKFYQYLKSQPQGPKAAEARYYLGDSFFQEKKYTEARVEYNKMVVQFPNSILAPTALLRQAYCYQETNQKTNFRIALEKLVQQYPQSPEAQEAKRQLHQEVTPR